MFKRIRSKFRLQSALPTARPDEEEMTPLERSRLFLDSLFDSRRTLIIGFFGQAGSCALLGHAMQDPFYYYYGFFAAFVILYRYWTMWAFDGRREHILSAESTQGEVNAWYVLYIAGTSLSALVVGGLSGYSIYFHPASWASTITLGLTMGTMVAAVGRNFGNSINIDLILLFSFGPTILGFLGYGIEHNDLLIGICAAIMLVPFALATHDMSRESNRRFGETQDARFKAERMSEKLSLALTNMPSGLIVVRADKSIKFTNENALKMFGLPEGRERKKKNIFRKFDIGARKGLYSKEQAAAFKGQLERLFKGQSRSERMAFNPDFVVEFSIREVDGSDTLGCHAPHDDYVLVCEDVTRQVNDEKRVRYSANFDMLSDLPNRRHMRDLVHEACDRSHPNRRIAFSIFDVDKFKSINDTQGHAAGDLVIRGVADSMKAIRAKHPKLIISRLGGDEFVMALPDIPNSFDVKAFFDDAFKAICGSYEIDGKTIEVRCSGGVIVQQNVDFHLDTAMQKSDLALYKVKKQKKLGAAGRADWCIFDDDLEQSYRNKQQLRNELPVAVANKQMLVHYQPMFTPDGSKIGACEALVRWDHPELGMLSPMSFIKEAESMNLVGEITRHVIVTACRDCATWDDSTSVSVNLSALDLANFSIVEIIASALRVTNLDPQRLQIEITESDYLRDAATASSILQTLSGMGVKTAMDDFGTGYSNLAVIGSLPLDKLKVDRSFVENIVKEDRRQALLEAVVMIGEKLGLGVVVEGIETFEQLDRVNRAGGVELIQGYYFGRPMPNDMIREMIHQQQAASRNGKIVPLFANKRSGS